MNILYFSLHQILEDDEVRMLKGLGHNVCVLGANSEQGSIQTFRKPLTFNNEELRFYRIFRENDGFFDYLSGKAVLPPAFLAQFDVAIVMHNPQIIIDNWPLFKNLEVVWRTIGQGVDSFEDSLRPYRERGLHIVRYSDVEKRIPNSMGQDAIIRFVKNPEDYGQWTGVDLRVLTFAHTYEQRYPLDAADYRAIVSGLPSALGGTGNDNFENILGFVDDDTQTALYRRSRVYLYASGLQVPYTLNFIEAWMTGTPIVVHAPLDRVGRYFEIDALIEDGVTGFICRDIRSTRARLQHLLDDEQLAVEIGRNGRNAAIQLFGRETIARQWGQFFENIKTQRADRLALDLDQGSTVIPPEAKPVNLISPSVFDTLALLKPYDIDIAKIRIGNERDGGYVLADDNLSADLLSFGVGPDVTFEFDMAERGARVFLNDHTVEGCPQHHARFHFAKLGICAEGFEHAELKPLSAFVHDLVPNGPLHLKMDVEGYEWDVFSTVSQDLLERFDQITLEVHWLERLDDPAFHDKAKRSLTNLNRQFTLFHVHANNCAGLHIVKGYTVASVLELSYIKTTKVKRRASRTVYPSSLNKANHPNYHDWPLLFFPFIPTDVSSHSFLEMIGRIDMEQRLSQ